MINSSPPQPNKPPDKPLDKPPRPGKPRPFRAVFHREAREIRRRRLAARVEHLSPNNTVGLALSGGGIRSATVCLGILQAFNSANLLRMVDYLSTVSGGGFTGSFWSAWLSRNRKFPPLLFPPPEATEANRSKVHITGNSPDGSASAGLDPIHHLRLFSNYLTPRKGLLSADTWRAASTVLRNLLLTWVVLLPILFLAVLVGQLIFAVTPLALPHVQLTSDPWIMHFRLQLVLHWAAVPTILFGALSLIWLVLSGGENPNDTLIRLPKIGALILIISYWIPRQGNLFFFPWTELWQFLPIATWMALAVFYVVRINPLPKCTTLDARRLYSGWFSDAISGLARTGVVLTLVIAVAAFAHVTVDYFIRPDHDLFARIAGYSAAAISIANAVFVAFKAAPTGGADSSADNSSAWQAKLMTLIAPPLLLAALLLLAGWLSMEVLRYMLDPAFVSYRLRSLTLGTLIGTTICFVLATLETRWLDPYGRRHVFSRLIISLLAVMTFVWLEFTLFSYAKENISGRHFVSQWMEIIRAIVVALSSLVFLLYRANIRFSRNKKLRKGRIATFAVTILLAMAVGIALHFVLPIVLDALVKRFHSTLNFLLGWISNGNINWKPRVQSWSAARTSLLNVAFAALTFAAGWIIAICVGRRSGQDYRRPLALLMGVAVTMASLIVLAMGGLYWETPISPVPSDRILTAVPVLHVLITLTACVLCCVMALGWLTDPNAVSLHAFYRSRLVRAYLGASNRRRREHEADIHDRAPNDDIPLRDLRNCEYGGPYHLINTTLNLVGSRDLSSAQRSSAAFVLSKHYCGSLRTGYRETGAPTFKRNGRRRNYAEMDRLNRISYMSGTLTLGTAAAISGAAVSPTSGARTGSAALAMLLTLFNVRLGFWAPTPHKERWNTASATLWPYYTLREFLSNTNDLQPYCYLTDGGHFDNTGLYSLIQRGTRYVILADCGADPQPCFQDLGDAVRRCRIDFKAEISLDIRPFERPDGTPFAKSHFVAGTIQYDLNHLASLYPQLSQDELEDRSTGIIVWFKPCIVDDDILPDVRQYAIENKSFPQETTADQWFDEAQFESYRRLAEESTRLAFAQLSAAISKIGHGPMSQKLIEDFFSDALKKFGKDAITPLPPTHPHP